MTDPPTLYYRNNKKIHDALINSKGEHTIDFRKIRPLEGFHLSESKNIASN